MAQIVRDYLMREFLDVTLNGVNFDMLIIDLDEDRVLSVIDKQVKIECLTKFNRTHGPVCQLLSQPPHILRRKG